MYLLLWLLTELKLLFFTQSNFHFIALFTDEKRGKSHIRGVPPVSATPTHTLRVCVNSPLLYISPLSPRGDQCEQSAPTVRLQHNHGYRFETLKRRLGFAAVPCQTMANLAVEFRVRVWGSLCADGINIPPLSCQNAQKTVFAPRCFG